MTESSIEALNNLRKTDNIQWIVVPLLIFVIYVYATEIERKNWNVILLAISASACEFIWEMINALILHFTNYAPLWTTSFGSNYEIYAGFNIEIAVMFSIAAILLIKTLPADKNKKILGVSNRILIPVIWGLICVFVEVILYKTGLLIWDYWWWCWPHIYLIVVVYTLPWILIAWLYDNFTIKLKGIGTIFCVGAASLFHIIFALVLKWI